MKTLAGVDGNCHSVHFLKRTRHKRRAMENRLVYKGQLSYASQKPRNIPLSLSGRDKTCWLLRITKIFSKFNINIQRVCRRRTKVQLLFLLKNYKIILFRPNIFRPKLDSIKLRMPQYVLSGIEISNIRVLLVCEESLYFELGY